MVKQFILIHSLTLLFVVTGFTQDNDITGKWKGTSAGPDGQTIEITFNFVAKQQTLTGSMEGPMGTMIISNGKIDGKKITFDISFNERNMMHSGEIVNKDKIQIKTEMMKMDLIREKEE